LSDGTAHPRPGPLSRRDRIDRHRARAWALQVHYLWETAGHEGRTLADALEETRSTRRIAPVRLAFVRRLIHTLDANMGEVDRVLEANLENWRLDRLSFIDRGILRLAATELLHFDDVPPLAAIQEAVRLAEAYGGNESPRFVNGVLDALYRRDRASRV
jgi:N utilization substance protein B